MSASAMLGILTLIAAAVAVWPFGLYQLSLMVAARLHRFPALRPAERTDEDLSFAICLCAYNEAPVIQQKVEDLLRLRTAAGGQLDILIYVDGASDRTAEILRQYDDILTLVISDERRGKTYGMNLLVSQTSADIIMFTDANVLIGADAVTVLRRYFSDRSIGCVCSDLDYVNAGRSATATVGAAYWRFNEWTKGLETETGSVIGADGSLFAIRRALHRPVPNGLFDDIYVSLAVLLAGYRVVRAPELKAYEAHTTRPSDEFRRKARIACECMHVHFALWQEIRQLSFWNLYKYVAHRLARWVSGYFLGLALLLAGATAWLAIGGLATLGLIGVAGSAFGLALRLKFEPAVKFWNVVLAFVGTSVGVWRAFAGERAVTWTLAASARELPVRAD